jgi:hypothetical protein
MVETFFKTLKPELVWRTMFETRRDAEQAIGHSIDGFYNPVRRHSALGFTSPAQVARMAVNGSNASPLNRSKSTARGCSGIDTCREPFRLRHAQRDTHLI